MSKSLIATGHTFEELGLGMDGLPLSESYVPHIYSDCTHFCDDEGNRLNREDWGPEVGEEIWEKSRVDSVTAKHNRV